MTTPIIMTVLITIKSQKELLDFPKDIYSKFTNYFDILEKGKPLSIKYFKRLSGTILYEFRVKAVSGIYRGLAGEGKSNLIVVLFFHKKSQKTPKNAIKTALSRLRALKK
jgi:phage-related protein